MPVKMMFEPEGGIYACRKCRFYSDKEGCVHEDGEHCENNVRLSDYFEPKEVKKE